MPLEQLRLSSATMHMAHSERLRSGRLELNVRPSDASTLTPPEDRSNPDGLRPIEARVIEGVVLVNGVDVGRLKDDERQARREETASCPQPDLLELRPHLVVV